jgi:SAM-dependent methyltransferase
MVFSLPDRSVLGARIRSVPRHLRACGAGFLPVPDLDQRPDSPIAWIAAANRRLDELDEDTVARLKSHDLRSSSYGLRLFLPEISRGAGGALRTLYQSGISPSTLATAIDEIIRWKTIAECAYSHRAGPYFEDAEPVMAAQWEGVIWPIIASEDFSYVIDLACGHGRNTEMLRRRAKIVDMVDVNASCIASCQERFGDRRDGCEFRYHLTDGNGLNGVGDGSVSFVYSWDSMVHFDRLVIRDYLFEIKRVLKVGGSAFLHHSNFGAFAPNSDWRKNHGSRSDMTAALMVQFAGEAGLSVKFQRLSGQRDGWGINDLDCLSLLAN